MNVFNFKFPIKIKIIINNVYKNKIYQNLTIKLIVIKKLTVMIKNHNQKIMNMNKAKMIKFRQWKILKKILQIVKALFPNFKYENCKNIKLFYYITNYKINS